MDIWQQTVAVNDTHLYVERAGSGATLLLVHGGGGDRRYWDAQFIELAQQFDVVRYDLRGYGKSDAPVEGQPYGHEDDLQSLLQALGVPNAHIAGYSLGCQVAVDAYTIYPELFRSIIAVGPYVSGFSSPATNSLFGGYAECAITFSRAGSAAAAKDFLSIPAFNPERIHAKAKTKLLEICGDYSWWWANHEDPMENVSPVATDVLANIHVPLLAISAEFDATVCREVADLLARSVADNQRVDISAATHFMLLEKPAEFNRALVDFLQRVDDGAD
ncbi:MAG: alpha/beta fold hydrolase [Pseudomonadales bacterium]